VRAGLVWPNRWYRDVLLGLALASALPLREVLGRQFSLIYASYNVLSVGVLILMALALTLPTSLADADRRTVA